MFPLDFSPSSYTLGSLFGIVCPGEVITLLHPERLDVLTCACSDTLCRYRRAFLTVPSIKVYLAVVTPVKPKPEGPIVASPVFASPANVVNHAVVVTDVTYPANT